MSPGQPLAEMAEATTPGRSRRVELGFLGHVNLVFLTYVAQGALAFGVAVLVARALGPEGRGVYALFLLSASIAQAVLSLGIGVSAVYYLGKRAYPLSRVVANSQQVTLAAAVVSALLAVGVAAGDVDTTAALLFWSAATCAATVLALGLLGKEGLRPGELLRVDWTSMRDHVR